MPFANNNNLNAGELDRRATVVDGARDPAGRLRAALTGQNYADGARAVSARDPQTRYANDGSNAPSHPYTAEIYDANRQRIDGASADPRYDSALKAFEAHWNANKARYFAVAHQVDLPPELIAALHWRESSGDFSTYLHQGDPLGKPAVNIPNDIPIFYKWEDSAVHALKLKRGLQSDMGLRADSTDIAAAATYAEHYNGLGYAYMDKPSPYVLAGTDAYDRGKYVADGRYSAGTRDRQPGVVAMMGRVSSVSTKDTSGRPKATPTLREGANGAAVKELQRLLGLPPGEQDGAFGPKTRQLVVAFQRDKGLSADGVVGASTWAALRGSSGG